MQDEVKPAPPQGPVKPTINGVVDSYFEWLGAGIYQVDQRQGSMHGKRSPVREVRYGVGDSRIFLRVDFEEEGSRLEGLEILAESPEQRMKIRLKGGSAAIIEGAGEAAFRDVAEIALPAQPDRANQVRLSFWQDGLPIQSVPSQGFLDIPAIETTGRA